MPSLTQVAEKPHSRKITLVFKSYSGEYEWKFWRHSLMDRAPMLFQ
jgi:hypothetical protein